MHFKGLQYIFLNHDVFLSMEVVLNVANSADLDEIQHYAAFHLGLHCLPKFLGVSSMQRINLIVLQDSLVSQITP